MKATWLAACLFLLAGCSKTSDGGGGSGGNGNSTITLKVLESKSRLPVAGATVKAEKCIKYDIEFGCVNFATVATLVTDAEGNFTVSREDNIERISASHPNYWPGMSNAYQYIYLKPEAWARVHLRKVNSYPANSQMNIGKVPPFLSNDRYSLSFKTPSDSTVLIRLYGDEEDQISWSIWQGTTLLKEGRISPPVIPRLTTADVTLDF